MSSESKVSRFAGLDVDDGFTGELIGILREDVLQGRIVNGQDHDVAIHRSRRVSVPNVIDRGTTGSQHVSDRGPMLPVPKIVTFAMKSPFSICGLCAMGL